MTEIGEVTLVMSVTPGFGALSNWCLSETSARLLHVSGRQPCGRKFCVSNEIPGMAIGSRRVLEMYCSTFLTMT